MRTWRRLLEDPVFPYFCPFMLFGVFLWLESLHPQAVYAVYPIKAFCVALALGWLWPRLPVFALRQAGGSILIGVAVFVLWVGLDPVLVRRADYSGGFNPFVFQSTPGGTEISWSLAAFRILGAALVVPVMEELFWRGFLMRFLINQNDFEQVPMGTYRPVSFFLTTAAFASVHGIQWPLAVMAGLIYGGWFVRTKSLGSVMLAHGVTNLLLGAYVLISHRWYFW